MTFPLAFTPAAPARPERPPGAPVDHEEPLELPDPWSPPSRPAVPLLASVVPILGAGALWLVTGSLLSLWLAALGPVIAAATMLDAVRAARRERRRAESAAAVVRARVSRGIGERHARERTRRWARHPDVAAMLARDSEIWRPVAGRADVLVVGSGPQPSGVRVTGGGDEPESIELRTRAAILGEAPFLISPSAGIAVQGSAVAAVAVVRALVLQLCLLLPPGAMRISGTLSGENGWADALPHRQAASGAALVLVEPGETIPAGADFLIVRVERSASPPPQCRVLLTVHSPEHAVVDVEGDVHEITTEAIGAIQAETIAAELGDLAARTLDTGGSPEPIALGSLLTGPLQSGSGTLPAVLGVESGKPRIVDLVADGPHAIVAGVTGAGKSELLVTWVTALCAAHSTRQVSFLLADFKGGTAFDALGALPHVTGVLTDLDGAGARRAIESLRAEVRWRESELARSGARDILDPRVELPRLVIVVDEFAALLGDHPELHAVFADVAARGRALGMHLVLGTQRPAGVIRESLLANCPLRISLRVGDASDSRVVIGTADAAGLPGGAGGRGLALVRTAGDAAPRHVRIALTSPDDVRAVAAATHGPAPRRPWLPALPGRIELNDLLPRAAAQSTSRGEGMLVVGLADEPEHQRQTSVGVRLVDRGLLVIGAPGSGKSTALRTLAAQAPGAVRTIPRDAEGAWDAVRRLVETPAPRGALIVIDDLDVVASALPPEYGRELADRLEAIVRGAGDAGVLILASARRLTGSAARLGDLLPRRLVLGATTRSDYVAAGGDPAHFCPNDGPGRGRLEGCAVQVAVHRATGTGEYAQPEGGAPIAGSSPATAGPWHPIAPLTGFVCRRSPAMRATAAAWDHRGARVIPLDQFAAGAEWTAETATDAPVVVVGEAEDWQRHWRVLASIRADHDLVIDASCGGEYRLLTGDRVLPPYCEPGRNRAWLLRAGGAPERLALPVASEEPAASA